VFEDAIQVRGQKENNVHKQKVDEESLVKLVEKPDQPMKKEKSPAVFTDIVMLKMKNQRFECIVAPINEKGQEIVPLPEVVKSRVIEEYGSETEPLPIIAITDGAKVIRQHLYSIFGVTLFIILDGYHLGKKSPGFYEYDCNE